MTLTTGVPTGLAPELTTVAGAAGSGAEGLRDVRVSPRLDRRRVGRLVVVLDVLAPAVAWVTTVGLTHGVGRHVGNGLGLPPALAVLLLCWPLVVALAGGYARLAEEPYALGVRSVLAAGTGLATAVWLTVALAPASAAGLTPRSLAVTTLLGAATVTLTALAARLLLPLLIPRRPLSALVVGPEAEVRALLREADRPARRRAFTPVAVCLPDLATDDPGRTDDPWPVVAWHAVGDDLLDVVHSSAADAVVVVPGPGVGPTELRRWAAWLQDADVQLLVSPGLRDVAASRVGTATLGGARLVRVDPARLTGPGRLLKGAVDRVAACLLLLALAPVLGLLTVLIRTDSEGRAWFRQTRVGRDGKPFTLYKLRTMRVDADDVRSQLLDDNESDRDGVLFKIRRDPRITRVGAVLRRYSLDELPQLVNVVRGEMSLVGPRPALPQEVQAYGTDLRRRLVVRPGLTGLWQVSGRSDLSWEETVRLDLQYVDNWSWGLDLSIVVRTVRAVLGSRGAY